MSLKLEITELTCDKPSGSDSFIGSGAAILVRRINQVALDEMPAGHNDDALSSDGCREALVGNIVKDASRTVLLL